MNKVPIAVISNDWHIKDDNYESILDLVVQKCKFAVEMNVKYLFLLGDIFTSRKSQSQIVINTFETALDIIQEYKLKLVLIPGNHDKTVYTKVESYLSQFRHHPAVFFIDRVGMIPFKEYNLFVHFIPFFADQEWQEMYSEYLGDHLGFAHGEEMEGVNVLCSHIAVKGSVNNDGKKVDSPITPKQFKYWDKVFLGHYHNMQQVSSNIFHLPSIQQNNFGEDNNKGFTVLYSDASHEVYKSNFKEFIKVKVDLNEVSKQELSEIVTKYGSKTENNYVRIILEGTEEKLKSIDKDLIKSVGIDVKTENRDIEIIEDFDTVEIKKYNDESIVEEFVEFCKEYDKDFETGIKYLRNEQEVK